MDRKDFIRKGLLGTSIFATGYPLANAISNNIDELRPLDIIGFNHIPQISANIMTNTVLHKANTRGHADHGWLNSYHSFSFAHYYNPDRMHFGVLRVLNDDTVAAGMGFGTHPHDNMEIISIPLAGNLEHKDSMGNVAVIRNGDVQVMSAGIGIQHSEYNKSSSELVKFLQIWVFPNQRNVKPRYDQLSLNSKDRKNRLQQIVSPNPDDEGVWIYQNAWFHLADFDAGFEQSYHTKQAGNGVYVFVLSGELNVNGQSLQMRDGLGVWDTPELVFTATQNSEFLVMDVPMTV
jgi:redox-sensitive bicupin YhaK (pirin superfamily)